MYWALRGWSILPLSETPMLARFLPNLPTPQPCKDHLWKMVLKELLAIRRRHTDNMLHDLQWQDAGKIAYLNLHVEEYGTARMSAEYYGTAPMNVECEDSSTAQTSAVSEENYGTAIKSEEEYGTALISAEEYVQH